MVNIADPEDLSIIGWADTPNRAYSLAAAGDVVYVACHLGGLRVCQTMTFFPLLAAANWAQSLPFFTVPGHYGPITGGRITSQQIGQIDWALSGDGGASWISLPADEQWHPLDFGGGRSAHDLIWRAELIYDPKEPLVTPTCSNLEIEWLYEFPIIDAITDVPEDQGGQVNLSWTRSGYDLQESPTPITEYEVYRRVDPPGDWELLTTVPVDYENEYTEVVSTLEDSTLVGGMAYSTFFVRALTISPDLYFDSPPDSGYSVDNLSPCVPEDFHFETDSLVAWYESPDEDFDHFTVYGSSVEYLDESADVIGETTGTSMDISGHPNDYYHVTATDVSGNEGEEATLGGPTDVLEATPEACVFYSSSPNPFTLQTVIRFALPDERSARLTVYSVDGRRIATLVDGRLPAGHHAITWTGQGDEGHPIPSGVYLCRLEAGGYVEARRIILVE